MYWKLKAVVSLRCNPSILRAFANLLIPLGGLASPILNTNPELDLGKYPAMLTRAETNGA